MDAAHGGMLGPRTCMSPFQNPTLTAVVFCHCWSNADAFSLLYEPPYTEPYVRWCGRTAEVTPPPTRLGVLFARQDVGEVGGVEVAAGDDGDDFAGYVGGQRAGDGAGARAFGDDVVVLGQVTNGGGHRIEICHKGAVDQCACAFEHLREHAFRSDAVNPRRLVVNKSRNTRGERRGERRCGRNFRGEHATRRTQLTQHGRNPTRQPTTTPRNHHRINIRHILEYLERNRPIPRHHMRVVERMNKRPRHTRKRALLKRNTDAIPHVNPPPPHGITTASTSGTSSSISRMCRMLM